MAGAPTLLEWFSLVPTSATAVAVCLGVWVANRQLSAWRTQAVETRNAEVAEQLLFAAANVDAALRYIRNPWGNAPPEGEERAGWEWRERLQRVDERKSDFDELQRSKIRARAFLGDPVLDSAVDELLSVRQEVWAALGSLVLRREVIGGQDRDLREFYHNLEWDVWGTYSDRDRLGTRQVQAIKTIEEHLYPVVRLQSARG